MSNNEIVNAACGESFPTPECDKMMAVRDDAAVLTEFLDYLDLRGLQIWDVERHGKYAPSAPFGGSREQLLADFFKIDLDKVEEEKRELLARFRAQALREAGE